MPPGQHRPAFTSCCIHLHQEGTRPELSVSLGFMQATYFDQNFSSTLFLDPEEAGLPAAPTPPAGTKGLQRLKRTPRPLPDEQHEDSPEPQHSSRGQQPMAKHQEMHRQREFLQAGLEPHEAADDPQQQQDLQQATVDHHADANAQTQGRNELPAFSLDHYFARLQKQPLGQERHGGHDRPADDELLGAHRQQVLGSPPLDLQLDTVNASNSQREIEEELLTTIEEQDEVIRCSTFPSLSSHTS